MLIFYTVNYISTTNFKKISFELMISAALFRYKNISKNLSLKTFHDLTAIYKPHQRAFARLSLHEEFSR